MMGFQVYIIEGIQKVLPPVTTSRVVAEYFEKEHFHVLRDIDNLIIQNWMVKSWFFLSTY